MRRRAGFTVIETMIALTIVALLSVIAFPKLRNSMIKANVRGARNQLANMLTAARTVSEQSNRSTALRFNGNVAWVTATPRRTVGGSGNPINASPAEQTARAQTLFARGGARQWGCGSHLYD